MTSSLSFSWLGDCSKEKSRRGKKSESSSFHTCVNFELDLRKHQELKSHITNEASSSSYYPWNLRRRWPLDRRLCKIWPVTIFWNDNNARNSHCIFLRLTTSAIFKEIQLFDLRGKINFIWIFPPNRIQKFCLDFI